MKDYKDIEKDFEKVIQGGSNLIDQEDHLSDGINMTMYVVWGVLFITGILVLIVF